MDCGQFRLAMSTIELDLDGVMATAIGAKDGISSDEWVEVGKLVTQAQLSLAERRRQGKLGFMDLPDDAAQLALIQQEARRVRYKFDTILVLGIGGSSLGLRCLLDALLGPAATINDIMKRRSFPKILVLDNVDPDEIVPILNEIDWRKTCVNVISKSGRTAETAAQFMIVRQLMEQRLGPERWRDNVVITTDPSSGPLRALAVAEGIRTLPIPTNVGGRFSVLSAVGMFPAACAGIDVTEIMVGARKMLKICGSTALDDNPATALAAAAKTMTVMMPYCNALQRFGDWYVQLAAESLGKNGLGQTPLRAVGATDQHSQMQLFMDGPNNKVITIITVNQFHTVLPIPETDNPDYQYLGGHDLSELLNTEARGTRQALQEVARPVIHLRLPRLDAQQLGQLIIAYEWSIAVSGELYGIDAFNQPGVERGKVLTRELLQKLAKEAVK